MKSLFTVYITCSLFYLILLIYRIKKKKKISNHCLSEFTIIISCAISHFTHHLFFLILLRSKKFHAGKYNVRGEEDSNFFKSFSVHNDGITKIVQG